MNIAIFASGVGSNYTAISNAIKDGKLDATINLVVCDKENAEVIKKVKKDNNEIFVFNPKKFNSKSEYEKIIVEKCIEKDISLIVLAGYMRILGSTLLDAFPNRIINIHPSLLPAFKGKDAIGQAIEYGVKVMGVSIHYVNSEMDGGKIIAQKSFEVNDRLTKEEIENKVHEIEHILYPTVIQKLIQGGLK
ncbi:MAG: phosphoribosylglycinamide formyltransferase [Erysipelotrichaceae bacterium]|nr:phosphoribosylglycinamide formyltransferase [Erysipelotrichaceae bacterium]